jgi:hypothetical protein
MNLQPDYKQHGQTGPYRDVHIKKVPEPTWRRARQNALASGLSSKAYVTWLLDHSEPCEPVGPVGLPHPEPVADYGAAGVIPAADRLTDSSIE